MGSRWMDAEYLYDAIRIVTIPTADVKLQPILLKRRPQHGRIIDDHLTVAQHHTIVIARIRLAYQARSDIALHQRRISSHRLAVPTAAAGQDPDPVPCTQRITGNLS